MPSHLQKTIVCGVLQWEEVVLKFLVVCNLNIFVKFITLTAGTILARLHGMAAQGGRKGGKKEEEEKRKGGKEGERRRKGKEDEEKRRRVTWKEGEREVGRTVGRMVGRAVGRN